MNEPQHATRVASEAEGNVWVVDYDLRAADKNRYRFYRALNKLKKQLGLHGKLSTQSVIVTRNEELAWQIYNLARQYAPEEKDVHIYGPLRER